ncbi:MAG TPA: 3-methyl-2-oxobutanoate hydroxymethyltransferase, partial [Nannocystis sp.]
LGLDDRFKPRFVKRYAELAGVVREAFATFGREVREGLFPGVEHSFGAASPAASPGSDEAAE